MSIEMSTYSNGIIILKNITLDEREEIRKLVVKLDSKRKKERGDNR